MSDLAEAFEDALDAAEEAKGSRETVTFQGNLVDALIFENVIDYQPGAGGEVDATPITVSLRLTDVVLPVPKLTPIIVRDRNLQVFHFTAAEGRVDLYCGDPSAEYNG